jgi:hypothetical protein
MEVRNMLKKEMEQFIQKKNNGDKHSIELYREEKDYALKNELIDGSEISIIESSPETRFKDAYIERGNKETEEFIAQEKRDFLERPITYFLKHKNEFMYMESDWWEMIGVDAVSFENDDVFETYDVMLGLKLQKKYDSAIRGYLSEHLKGEGAAFDLMFDGNEGLWSLNYALNDLEGFNEDLTIGEAYSLIYSFLFRLAESVEGNK